MYWLKWWGEQPAAARLTAAYVAILMVICLIFSLSLYRLSVDQLENGLRHQYTRLHPLTGGGTLITPPNLVYVEDELESGKRRLAGELIYFNLIILLLGSGASYWLAKRTLRPIEDALEAQGRFTADASHELRTPLTAMQTEIEVALRSSKLSKEEATDLLKSNLEEVAKLRALSDGLLRLANGNGKDMAFAPIPVSAFVEEAIRRVGRQASGKKISINSDAGAQKVMGDKESLVELVSILLDNAIKYSEEGAKVQVSSKAHGRYVDLVFSDEGMGIQASDLTHIFDRFYRADTSRAKEGYGLGLSIAQKLAGLHGGAITVKSVTGKGSVFTVRLPLAEV